MEIEYEFEYEFKYDFDVTFLKNPTDKVMTNIEIMISNEKMTQYFGINVFIYKNNKGFNVIEVRQRAKQFFEIYIGELCNVKNGSRSLMEMDGQNNFQCYNKWSISKNSDNTFTMKFKYGTIVLKDSELDKLLLLFKDIIDNIDKITSSLIEQKTLIYVLKLTEEKYYVGKTDKTVEQRFEEHIAGQGSEWTKLYEPIEIIKIITDGDDYDEDKYTKMYMNMYGIDNVRGGSYTSIILPDYQIKSLEIEICTSNNRCFKCQKTGHFASSCNAVPNIPVKEQSTETIINSEPIKLDMSPLTKTNKYRRCNRCGRSTHWIAHCYAKTHINGNILV